MGTELNEGQKPLVSVQPPALGAGVAVARLPACLAHTIMVHI